ncbi:hypothetical protein D3C72_2567230 [compost metagenome]
MFIKLAVAVEIAPIPPIFAVPALLKFAIDEVPPMLRVFVAVFVNVPTPERPVEIVRVPILLV